MVKIVWQVVVGSQQEQLVEVQKSIAVLELVVLVVVARKWHIVQQ